MDEIMNEDDELTEFILPKDFSATFCRGCQTCFRKGEDFCPDHEAVAPIAKALDEANLIILASPTYCYGISGPLKALLDHFGYMWMEHRPKASMFNKVALVLATSGLPEGSKKVVSQLRDQANGWGISQVIEYAKPVQAGSWKMVPSSIKESISKDVRVIADEVKRALQNPQAYEDIISKFMLYKSIMQKNTWNMVDRNYWEALGWLNDTLPWQKQTWH
jgi:multimeric flavodoxin WrbA